MSEETKNPLIESFIKLHEKMIGYGGKDDPYQGRSQQKFTADKTTPDALRVKPSAPSTQAAPKKAEPAPAPKPKAEAPIPKPKPEQPDKSISPTGNPNMLGIGAKPYDPLSSIKAPEPKPILPSTSMSGGSGDYRKPYDPLKSVQTPTPVNKTTTSRSETSIAASISDNPANRNIRYTGPDIKQSPVIPSTDSKQRGPMPISGEKGSAMSHNFSTDLVDMLADKSTKMRYNTDAITGKNQTFMQRLTNNRSKKSSVRVSPEIEKTLKSIKIGENENMTNKLIDSFLQLQAMETNNIFEAAKKVKKLDPVGKEDGDIDNDGDKDKSDSYLHNRRKKIASAMKEAKDPHAEGMVKAGTKAPEMTTDPDYAKKKPAVQTPNRAEKGSLPKGVTVKTNEEVEQIDEALSADHKAAIKAHIRGMWGKGEVAFGNQGGREFVSHSDGIQKHVHSIHMKKGVPHVTHFLSMDEEVGFSEAELEHISAILEGPAAPTPDDYSSKAFGSTASRSGTLSDETVSEEEKRGRGRPKGSKSGSMHGSGTGEGAETKNLAAQIRHTRPSGGNFELKHPTTGETKSVPAKAATEFYNKYTGSEKPAEKQAHHDEFLAKHFGSKEKPKTGITLPKMPAPKS